MTTDPLRDPRRPRGPVDRPRDVPHAGMARGPEDAPGPQAPRSCTRGIPPMAGNSPKGPPRGVRTGRFLRSAAAMLLGVGVAVADISAWAQAGPGDSEKT